MLRKLGSDGWCFGRAKGLRLKPWEQTLPSAEVSSTLLALLRDQMVVRGGGLLLAGLSGEESHPHVLVVSLNLWKRILEM